MTESEPYPDNGKEAIHELEKKFEHEYRHWNEQHSKPLISKRGQAMQKPKQRHIACLTRTQNLLETGINVEGNKSLESSILNDIELLCEIRAMLYQIIENPSLPFSGPEPADEVPALNPIEEEPNEAD